MYQPKRYLFNGKRQGQRWANRSAQWSVKTARTGAKVEREVSPHVFRHCYATHHLESGTNLVFLKEQMGHKHLKTTARYISLCKSYQYQVNHKLFLVGLKQLMEQGAVIYHRSYEDIEAEVGKIRWVVHNTRPTANTKVIEEYLGRYICRIGISNKRLSYDKHGKNVRIEYNDYANQKTGQPAPKKYRDLPPLVAMHLFLQHQLPAYFQRVRYYGLHASATYTKVKDKIPDQLKRNGKTVRTVIQILTTLLATKPYQCGNCGGTTFDTKPIKSDRHYLNRHILHQGRSPPSTQADTKRSMVVLTSSQ